ncbi:MAG: hypothetical protein J3R72DRAFT_417690 [Linnemannia gamsii]|nr:MAG: hypothetical protein J3R72DRAFT_417690 [Linnemannia gamsii]
MTSTTPTPHKISPLDIPELVDLIAYYLDPYIFTQCLLVSKSFYKAFHPCLWRHFEPSEFTSVDPDLIHPNLPIIKTLSLTLLDHDIFPILTHGLPLVSATCFLRKQVQDTTVNNKDEENSESTLLSNILSQQRQPCCTNLTALFINTPATRLSPKEHFLFFRNILTLLDNNPNLLRFRIPVDILVLAPDLFLDIIAHRLPRLEHIVLGPSTTTQVYKCRFSDDGGDIDNDKLDFDAKDQDTDGSRRVIDYTRRINWETTVRLLETCLWKRTLPPSSRSPTSPTLPTLTSINCLYKITISNNNYNNDDEDIATLPGALARLISSSGSSSPSSSSSSSSTIRKSAAAPTPTHALKTLHLPCREFTTKRKYVPFSNRYTDEFKPYPTWFISPLLNTLPLLEEFSPEFFEGHRIIERRPLCNGDDNNNSDDRRRPNAPRFRWVVRKKECYSCHCESCLTSSSL